MLELRNLYKNFSGETVVADVSLEVPQGEFVSILGPSGCGKTTLLRLLSGFETPDRGVILWNGRDITMCPPNHRPFNMVFQRYALFPHMSVAENVGFGPCIRGESGSKLAKRVEHALDLVRLSGLGPRRIETLSGGQQQRVALARAVINRPQVLLLDEPMSALDRHLREAMRLDILTIQRALGITFLMVTHDQEEAMAMSDRIAVMHRGSIEQVDRPEIIYRRPNSQVVAVAIGALNKFTVQGKTRYVRPENLRLSRGLEFPASDSHISLSGVIKESLFRGSMCQYLVEIDDVDSTKQIISVFVQGHHDAQNQFAVDERVYVFLDQSRVIELS